MPLSGGLFDLDSKKQRIAELEQTASAPDFWNDASAAQKHMQKINMLKEQVNQVEELQLLLDDAEALWDLAKEADDEALAKEAEDSLKGLGSSLEQRELAVLLSGEYDDHNCILTVHSGAGGVEACDWAEMLWRMYTRFCERSHFKTEILDYQDGDEAGIKSATLAVTGLNAFGYLKAEKGVHRLVRISPFDAAARRHTSFASVSVIPQVAYDNEVEINDDDLRIDTYRSGGKGGQHLNKTDSAVRITHIPTGIVVQCQDERSQHSNKDRAMQMLAAQLLERKMEERERELARIQGNQQEIGWGSQIRSYVFQPYRLVKDHRTNFEMGNVDAVMDGDIEGFIAAYLQQNALKRNQ